MDIITHTLSGIALGTVLASFGNKSVTTKASIISLGGIGAALPDFDVISFWSGFDSSIGKTLNLPPGKEIYFSKFWYSHHGFLHSIPAAILIVMVFVFLIYSFKQKFRNLSFKEFIVFIKTKSLQIAAFVVGFIIHLFEDMPTPHCTWGGVNLLWPSKKYIGGTGEIWWWNNYDIFLIVVCVIFLNILVLLFSNKIKIDSKIITSSFFTIGLTFILFQIKTRPTDFNYIGHTIEYKNLEIKSKTIQKEILGEHIYSFMLKFDNYIPVNF